MGRTQEISEGNVARALLKEFQSSTPSPHLKVNGQVARSNINWFCSMPLLPDTFNCRTRSPSQDKRRFYLAVYLSRSGVQNIGLTSAPALETELELRAFCLVSILPRPWYFDIITLTHRRGSVNLLGGDVTRDPGRRKVKTRAREQRKQSAGLHQKQMLKSCWFWSKSTEGTSVHLELDNSSKAKNLSALWIIFPIEVLNSAHLI